MTATSDGAAAPALDQAPLDAALPRLRARVNDDAALLSASEAAALEAKLAAHEAATGQQFALLSIVDLPGADIERFGLAVARQWKLGRVGHDDGLLIVVAKVARKVDIEVGRGLERAIPNELAARVISQQIAPAFREGHYAAGLEAAFDQLMTAAKTVEPAR